MTDTITNNYVSGVAADHQAYESMTTSKDVINAINTVSNRQGDSFNAVERSIANSQSAGEGLVTDSSFRTLEQFGVSGVLVQKTTGELNTLVQKTSGEIVTQVTLTAKDGIIDAAKNAAAITLQAEKLASASVLQAFQLAAAQAAAAAECCCELKEKIGDDGDKTRELINRLEQARLAVSLVDTKIELSNTKQTDILRAFIASGGK